MLAEAATLEEAIQQFTTMRAWSPVRFSGKWFIAQTGEKEWRAFRTKSAAFNNTISQVWQIVL